MSHEQRSAPRLDVTLPVELPGGSKGTTRDLSVSGVYLETATQHTVGSSIHLQIDIDLPAGTFKLVAEGIVVRLESKGPQTGVAVKLVSSQLLAVD